MNRILCILATTVAVLIRGSSSAQSPTASSDTTALLGGVRDLPLVGSPGQLCVYGTNAFAVIAGDVGKSGDAVVVAAARWGKGRVVAYAHNGYIDANKDADAQRLMLNAVRWTGQSTAPKVGVHKKPALLKQLQGQQIDAVALDGGAWTDKLKDFKVVCFDSELIHDDASLAAVKAFVENGGGLITGSTGWGWLQMNQGKTLTADHWGNRLLSNIGIVWTDGTAGKTGGKGYVTSRALSPYLHADTAFRLAQQSPTPPPTKEALAQATWTITQAVRSIPADDTLLRPRFTALLTSGSQPVPSAAKPLKSADVAARLALSLQLIANQSAAPETIRAHPAAAMFPGEVPAAAPRLKGQVRSISSEQRGWKSLGLYAAPGELIRVTIPEIAVGKSLRIRIGCHSDRLWDLPSWSRAPEITTSTPMNKTVTTAANAFGGLVYIEVPDKLSTAPFDVQIDGAVEAPLFVLGKTGVDDWRNRIRQAPGPWAEIASDKLVITVNSSFVRNLDDPDKLMEFWNGVLDADADLRGIPHERKKAERFVADQQISAGYMHSGYPIMTGLDVQAAVINTAQLKSKGSWGHFHELGHNHQVSDWTFEGTTEVTCNLFSLYNSELNSGIAKGLGHPAVQPANVAKNTALHIGKGAAFEHWKADPFTALIMYMQLRDAFGWDTYKKVFAEYRDLPLVERPRTENDKRDQWMVRFSKAAGKNLGPFFQAWGVPTSDAARASIAQLPAWMPENFPPK